MNKLEKEVAIILDNYFGRSCDDCKYWDSSGSRRCDKCVCFNLRTPDLERYYKDSAKELINHIKESLKK